MWDPLDIPHSPNERWFMSTHEGSIFKCQRKLWHKPLWKSLETVPWKNVLLESWLSTLWHSMDITLKNIKIYNSPKNFLEQNINSVWGSSETSDLWKMAFREGVLSNYTGTPDITQMMESWMEYPIDEEDEFLPWPKEILRSDHKKIQVYLPKHIHWRSE